MIRLAIKTEAHRIALLHKNTITTGFLSKLGIDFLESLYLFLINNDLVFVNIEESEITGYISFSYNSTKIMRWFIFKSPDGLLKLLRQIIRSPFIIKEILETCAAPFKMKVLKYSQANQILPNAELLSMSVDPNCQRSGIGCKLLLELEEQLKQHRIMAYKVVAGASLKSANRFYIRNGFILYSQVKIHGNELSNIYIKELGDANYF